MRNLEALLPQHISGQRSGNVGALASPAGVANGKDGGSSNASYGLVLFVCERL